MYLSWDGAGGSQGGEGEGEKAGELHVGVLVLVTKAWCVVMNVESKKRFQGFSRVYLSLFWEHRTKLGR